MASAFRKEWIESVQDALQRHETELKEINQKIWSNPELSYEEKCAHDNICGLFESLSHNGYVVKRSTYGVDTSFDVEYSHGTGGRTVAFNAEYDALPGIGHACAHNLIATSSIAAFIAACEAMKKHHPDELAYTLRLIGTPAEEAGGGKICLLKAGAYKDVDACLMVHPCPSNSFTLDIHSIAAPLIGTYLANSKVRVTYTGKPAHAAAAPWEGINALDAAVAAYVNVSVLRQQMRESAKVHGIITHGGDRPNIIPKSAKMEFYIRSQNATALKELVKKVKACFEAAALSTGCTVEYEWEDGYADMQSNMPICETFTSVMKEMGHDVFLGGGKSTIEGGASTDMGNVSYAVPGFHGVFSVPSPKGAWPHTPEFTKAAGSAEGYKGAIECAAGMAVTACRILVDDDLFGSITKEFAKVPSLE